MDAFLFSREYLDLFDMLAKDSHTPIFIMLIIQNFDIVLK